MHSHSQPHATASATDTASATADTAAAGTAPAARHRSVAEHRQAVRNLLEPLLSSHPTERVPLTEALGRGLAETITARLNLPPFANSQMDGFAVRSQDVPDGGTVLRV